ncbi:NAD-dependent epimerase/dehydratase family protein [Halosimplex pelagicum]|uniref:NAD(P)-dependent oxidoreductase n=1 Tax=Halosimplex pelagicum TaxID=869886 RepID=A0A7D5PDN5_9EURY|nr:NAD(P)-dependent oxidoreductase [Halosimplex pelagicum]QLH84725.1 NAD(P)-dependent oxidoreductase [Halosimplex pelagicum]
MDVLITGGAGTIGTAITDHLGDREDYEFTSLDVVEHPDDDVESVVADATDEAVVREAVTEADAVVHLARVHMDEGGPTDRTMAWSEEHLANLRLHATAYEAAVDADLDTFVYASSNHAVGMYEVTNEPDIYYGSDFEVDHTVQPRPDSMYGVEKVYGEGLGRLAAETSDLSVYALRICAVRDPEYDHPYGDAQRGVDQGRFERDSPAYDEQVARMRCMWQSRRDIAQLVERCLADDSVEFDVFYGVSDNDDRWFDIDHARDVIGYDPRDSADEWDAPPS